MKRVELKRIAEILWKGNPTDEKTPFASQGTLPDNGSFSKTLDSEDIKKPKEFLDSDDDNRLEGPMSAPRKFCFVMSFNVWILYFLVLGWLLPCRNLECDISPSPRVIERNLSSIWLLTNLETVNVKGQPSLLVVGYGEVTELKLASLATFDAAFMWNNSLPFIPRKIQCNFEKEFDVNGDGFPDCLLSGYNDVYAFNVTNGHVFWHQSIPSEEGDILSGFHPTKVQNNQSFLIGTCGDKMVILDTRNGSKVSEISLPCDSPFEIKIVSNVVNDSLTTWSLVCDYGGQIEAWSFREQDVLNGEKLEKSDNATEFSPLFSGSNSGGSIDLGCDVTTIPGGPLLLSWSDRVAMVTQEETAWERRFPEPLTVAGIKLGHFLNAKELHIAAAVHNRSNTEVFVMDLKNGTILNSVSLMDKQAQSMWVLPDEDSDILVLKSLSFNYTIQEVTNNFTDPIPTEGTNFALVYFSKDSMEIKDITTTGLILGSALNVKANGGADLLIIKSDNGVTSYRKYIVHENDSQNVICIGSALNVQANGEVDLLVIKSDNGVTSYRKYIIHENDSQNAICIGSGWRHYA